MTSIEFKKIWTTLDNNLNPISPNRLQRLGLSKNSIEFLINAGLPDTAEPFLSFAEDCDEVYNGIHRLTTYYEFLEPEFNKYVAFGSCFDGDHISFDTENNDRIVYLDHENYFSEKPFNSSIGALAECLIAYRNFVSLVQQENGKDAFKRYDYTDEHLESLKRDLELADPYIMTNDGFWKIQFEMDFVSREEFRKEKQKPVPNNGYNSLWQRVKTKFNL